MKKIILAVVAFLAMLSVASCSFMDNSVEALKFIELPAETVLQSEDSTLVAKVQVISSDSTKTYTLEVGATAYQVSDDKGAVPNPGFIVEGAEGLAKDAAKGSYVLKLTLSGITLIHNYRVVGSTAEILFAAGTGTKDAPYLIETAQQLFNMRYAYDTVGGKYFKLGADIDLNNFKWIAVGTALKPFTGHFDGANHSIIGMTNALTDSSENEHYVPTSSGVSGEIFGLFGYAGASDAVVEIKDVKMVDVSLAGDLKGAAALVGLFADVDGVAYEHASLVISNVTVSGSISGKDKLGAFIGATSHNDFKSMSVEISNCTNNATIVAKNTKYNRAGAFVGQYSYFDKTAGSISFTNCVNNGVVKVISETNIAAAGDLIGHINSGGSDFGWKVALPLDKLATAKITISGCANNGSVVAQGTTSTHNLLA